MSKLKSDRKDLFHRSSLPLVIGAILAALLALIITHDLSVTIYIFLSVLVVGFLSISYFLTQQFYGPRTLLISGLGLLSTGAFVVPLIETLQYSTGKQFGELLLEFLGHVVTRISTGSLSIYDWVLVSVGICLIFASIFLTWHQSKAVVSRPPLVKEADISLFAQFNNIFPYQQIQFFRDHDFVNPFGDVPIQNLFEYTDNWNTSEHEFANLDLEAKHLEVWKKANKLAKKITEYTTTDGRGRGSVAPINHGGDPLPNWALEQANELNELSSDFVLEHQEFHRIAKEVLSQ